MESIWRDLKYYRVHTRSHRELAGLNGAVEQALYQKAQALLVAQQNTDKYLYLKT